ncbi:MAG: UdgX family uracil-DNA binding protein [Phycicoccus sp.]
MVNDWPGAAAYLPDARDLPALELAEQHCRGCDLFQDATQVVPGSGPSDASVMLVGEQPGDAEDLAGQPFVGPAGRLLVQALTEAGADPATVYRTNAVKHFRFSTRGKRRIHQSPSAGHVTACRPWLLTEVDAVRPDLVVLLGATAGRAVYGASFRVGAARGTSLQWPDGLGAHRPGRVRATVHPSAVLRSQNSDEDYAGLVADLRAALSHG